MPQETQNFYRQLDDSYAQGGMPRAEEFLLRYVKDTPSPYARVAACNELGSLYRGISHFDQSLSAFEQARTLSAELYGENRSEYATVLNNMAGTHRLAQNYDTAIDLFKQAIAIYAGAGETDSYLYASVWNNLSLAYQDTGALEDAIRCAQQALSIMEGLSGYQQELAITYNNLAALSQAVGNRDATARYLALALEAFDACPMEENVHYAAGLNSLAAVLYSTGAYEQALEAFQKSAEYTQHFFGENLEYAITQQNMGRVYEAMNDQKSALHSLCKAYDLYKALLGPEHPRTLSLLEEIAAPRGGCCQ